MNKSLDEILKIWEEDCKIDDVKIAESTLDIAKMHAKYLRWLSETKLLCKKHFFTMEELKKTKWLYYTGKMTKEEMDAKGWPYDPFNGASKPLRAELDMFIKCDKDVILAQQKIEYYQTIKEVLEEIMNTLRWRHSAIRNIIDWKKFAAGS